MNESCDISGYTKIERFVCEPDAILVQKLVFSVIEYVSPMEMLKEWINEWLNEWMN